MIALIRLASHTGGISHGQGPSFKATELSTRRPLPKSQVRLIKFERPGMDGRDECRVSCAKGATTIFGLVLTPNGKVGRAMVRPAPPGD
jgi:hypothetical protein